MRRASRPVVAGLLLCLVLALVLWGEFGPGLRPSTAQTQAPIATQQASPTPTVAGTPPRRSSATLLALGLGCLIALNAIGLGVMFGLSKRMQAIAEEDLQKRRRKR
ncbi:MAG: hypothetical protein OHK0022_02270 [Roseiflexaceae bacterium]